MSPIPAVPPRPETVVLVAANLADADRTLADVAASADPQLEAMAADLGGAARVIIVTPLAINRLRGARIDRAYSTGIASVAMPREYRWIHDALAIAAYPAELLAEPLDLGNGIRRIL